MAEQPFLVERQHLETLALCAAMILEQGDTWPEEFRAEVQRVSDKCSRMLLYGDDVADVKVMQGVSTALHVKGYYPDDFETQLDLTPQQVLDDNPALICMLRRAADLVDSQQYSRDFRMSAQRCYRASMDALTDRYEEFVNTVLLNETSRRRTCFEKTARYG